MVLAFHQKHLYPTMAEAPPEAPKELCAAVMSGRVRWIQGLLDAGCDANETDEQLQTPLMKAVHIKRTDARAHVVRLLLKYGADAGKQDTELRTALCYAAMQPDREDIVRILVRSGNCQVNLKDINGDTALFFAVRAGNVSVLRILLNSSFTKYTIDLNQANFEQYTALSLAYELGQYDCCKVLVKEANVDPNQVPDKTGLLRLLSKEEMEQRLWINETLGEHSKVSRADGISLKMDKASLKTGDKTLSTPHEVAEQLQHDKNVNME